MPEVSVIVNCFNEAKYLPETLDSVRSQSFPDWEVIFWDNASSDGSTEIAASYGDKVRCFRSDTMVPLGRARKLAYEQTRGNYVAILDADDVWLPDKLERQLQLFRSNPQLGMAYCDAIYFDEGGDRFRLFKLTNPHRGQAFGALVTKNFIFSSTMMFRKQALEDLGCAFDDKFSRAQDYDLTLRVAYQYPIDYVNAPLVKWRINDVADKPWKKSLPSRVAEVKDSVETLISNHPSIKIDYGMELQELYKSLDYNFGLVEWENGNGAEARKYLSRHLESRKSLFAYLSTYLFPYSFFAWLAKSRRKLLSILR